MKKTDYEDQLLFGIVDRKRNLFEEKIVPDSKNPLELKFGCAIVATRK